MASLCCGAETFPIDIRISGRTEYRVHLSDPLESQCIMFHGNLPDVISGVGLITALDILKKVRIYKC